MSSWPAQDWRRADPAAVGMRPELLADLEREVSARFGRIRAVLINRGGQLVFERYFGGCGQDDSHLVASVTKSVLSALVGIAIDRGFIRGVDQRVLDFFPDYAPGGHERLKRRLTLKHLLTMTAGFQWRTGPRGHELFLDRLRRSRDWVAFILSLPVKERALGTFQYNSAAAHLLSAIITRSTGRCAREFAATHLFGPLGIDLPADDTPHGREPGGRVQQPGRSVAYGSARQQHRRLGTRAQAQGHGAVRPAVPQPRSVEWRTDHPGVVG